MYVPCEYSPDGRQDSPISESPNEKRVPSSISPTHPKLGWEADARRRYNHIINSGGYLQGGPNSVIKAVQNDAEYKKLYKINLDSMKINMGEKKFKANGASSSRPPRDPKVDAAVLEEITSRWKREEDARRQARKDRIQAEELRKRTEELRKKADETKRREEEIRKQKDDSRRMKNKRKSDEDDMTIKKNKKYTPRVVPLPPIRNRKSHYDVAVEAIRLQKARKDAAKREEEIRRQEEIRLRRESEETRRREEEIRIQEADIRRREEEAKRMKNKRKHNSERDDEKSKKYRKKNDAIEEGKYKSVRLRKSVTFGRVGDMKISVRKGRIGKPHKRLG